MAGRPCAERSSRPRVTTPWAPGKRLLGVHVLHGGGPRSPWVTPWSFPLRAVLAHKPAAPQGWLLEASKLSQSQEPLSL